MVGVISLWTKPHYSTSGYKSNFGFLDMESACAALICCTHYIKKNHDSLIIITDTKGKALIESIGIECGEILTDLDRLNVSEEFWAVAKIKAYEIAAKKYKTFVHYDFDVFCQKKYEPNENEILLQSAEGGGFYRTMFDKMRKTCVYLPKEFLKGDVNFAGNAGVFGIGNKVVKKLVKYFKEPAKIIEENDWSKYDKRERLWVNMLIEQYFIVAIAKANSIQIKYILSTLDKSEAISKGYCHLWGSSKKDNRDAIVGKAKILDSCAAKKISTISF